ncbi:hypothetical protein DH2020_000832 [Rehmannia glutinosa]|uniref:Glutamate receptor n=1 Tax=Rehmannia glutinosa TaxID=99300 RepID=A0ABR0XXQ2_REHGL
MKTQACMFWLLLLGFLSQSYVDEQKDLQPDHGDKIIANIGVIVDMGSWEGKVAQSCITMAVSDFNNLNRGYRTRIALHVRDSKGDSLHSIGAALDLLENVELHAIIIPKISNEELFLARLGDKVNVSLLSFSSISSSSEHPYFIQVGDDENNQFHGIAAFLEAFRWRSFVFLYEDTVDARQAQTYIHDILKENHLDVAYQSAISLQATDDQIINELQTLVMMKASIIMVHLSPSLASRVFINAEMLGMISKGYAWIVTSKTMNLLDSQNSSVYESMQGVVGFKSYISASNKIQSLTLRWRREFLENDSNVESRELNVFGVLAEAIERAGIKPSQKWDACAGSKQLDLARLRVSDSGSAILSNITSSNFAGLVGKFQLTNRKLVFETYEILNLIGKEERRVGFWTSAHGLMKEINPTINSSSKILETIIWPGLSSTTPESWLVHMSGKSFRIGIPANARFSELLSLGHDWRHNITAFSGFYIDVFHAAVDRLPYKIAIEYIPFYKHYGTYNDLLYQVHLQNYDAAVGDITILSKRSAYVDFTVPYTESGVGVVVKLDDGDPWFFLKPLSADLWVTSACFFFLTGFIVWLVEHRINEEFQGPPAQQIGTALWFAASTLDPVRDHDRKRTKFELVDCSKLRRNVVSKNDLHAFPKGSPLVRDISRAICELIEEGKILQMEKKWFSSRSSLLSQETKPPNKASTLSMDNFLGLFLLSGIVKSIAILIFLTFLLREKLSILYYIFSVLARGKLISSLRHLYPRMVKIEEVIAR